MADTPVPIQRHKLPATVKELAALNAPIARLRQPTGPCILVGKIIDYSPLFFIVAVTAGGRVTTQKIKKSRVHTAPCEHCPDYIPSA